jgi:hypothetical protein
MPIKIKLWIQNLNVCTLLTDLPLCLANGGFSLTTVAEGKTMKRAAIPIMANNSLLSEVYCHNNGRALPIELLNNGHSYFV